MQSVFDKVKPTPESVLDNVKWLNVILIVVILFLFISFVLSLVAIDQFAASDATASNLGFSAFRDDKFAAERYAETPYPYDPSCGDVQNAVTYVTNILKQTNSAILNDPAYPAWKALYENYLKLQASISSNPANKKAADEAWAALQLYQNNNKFYPLDGQSPWVESETKSTDAVVGAYTDAAKGGLLLGDGFAGAPRLADNFAGVPRITTRAKSGFKVPRISTFAGAQAMPLSRFAGAQAMPLSRFAGAPRMADNFTGDMNATAGTQPIPVLSATAFNYGPTQTVPTGARNGTAYLWNDDALTISMNGGTLTTSTA